MERVVERHNMRLAYQRVVQNKGAPGVDGMTVEELKDWATRNWPSVKAALLEGRYIPQAVRRVDIPKPQGGVRTLGVPTVVDRLIQQALHQVLQPLFEPTFSEHSYGYRPGRSAHQAVTQAQAYIRCGKRWVVDMDLEKFFDRVNHDVLMARVARRVKDRRVLKLIRRYLNAGMMQEGLVEARTEGTPQGGPLSPLLSNILLADLDRELERRQLAFCRYADDCNIYVGSRAAGERILQSLTVFLDKKLRLKVNPAKSAVDRPWKRSFLGYTVTAQRDARLRVAPDRVRRLKRRIRSLMRAARGQALARTIAQLTPILRGWMNYFRLVQASSVFGRIDNWLRHRLRCVIWRHWKRRRTRLRKLLAHDVPYLVASNTVYGGRRGPWASSATGTMCRVFPPHYFAQLGHVSLTTLWRRLQRAH